MKRKDIAELLTRAAGAIENQADLTENSRIELVEDLYGARNSVQTFRPSKTVHLIFVDVRMSAYLHHGTIPMAKLADELIARGGIMFAFSERHQTAEELKDVKNNLMTTIETSHPDTKIILISNGEWLNEIKTSAQVMVRQCLKDVHLSSIIDFDVTRWKEHPDPQTATIEQLHNAIVRAFTAGLISQQITESEINLQRIALAQQNIQQANRTLIQVLERAGLPVSAPPA